jgi:hypothetical protein
LSYITGWGSYIRNETSEKYLGFDFTDMHAEIIGGPPPFGVTAAIGRFDPQATRDALKNRDEWPSWAVDAYTIEEYRGVTIHSWGDGSRLHLEDRLAPPHIDEMGRIKPLAVTGEFLFYAPSVETIKLMIDASQGKIESLADLPEFAAVAGKLPELNVYMACIGYEFMVNGDPEYTGTYPGPRLKKFLTFASGTCRDAEGYYTALLLYHENPDNAKANVSLLEERINTSYSIISGKLWNEIIMETGIQVDGNLLVAKLYTEHPGIWGDWVYARDPLLLHENM